MTTVRGIRQDMKNSEYKAEIGRRIAKARAALGEREGREVSLADLSKRTGGLLSKTRIGNYEQGDRMPGPAEANILAGALDVDAAYLMCLQQELNKHQLDFIRNWMTLPENIREDYFGRIETLSLAYRKPLPDEKLTPGYAEHPAKQQSPARREKRRPDVRPAK